MFFFFFKQKTAYEMRISDWSSDVCSSDLGAKSPLRKAMSAIRDNFNAGQAGASSSPAASSASTAGGVGPPAWAKAMKRRQAMMHGASVATHTLRSGDSHGGGAGPNISEKD